MQTIDTKVHIGTDGILRLELPVESRDQDVRVTIQINDGPTGVSSAGLPAYMRAPSPRNSQRTEFARIEVKGKTVSQQLIDDRR